MLKKCQAIDAGTEDSACTGTYDFNMLSSARCCDYNSYSYNAFRSLVRHFSVRYVALTVIRHQNCITDVTYVCVEWLRLADILVEIGT